MAERLTIAVTDTMGREDKFRKYPAWLERGNIPVRCERISYAAGSPTPLSEYEGIVLTGGGDVDPRLYGGDPTYPGLKSIDRRRDDFERGVIDTAVKHRIPLLGICRGLQIANVHFGGTLTLDLQDVGFADHTSGDDRQCWHDVEVFAQTRLEGIAGATRGTVNTHHHQAATRLGTGLRKAAQSPDGVVEAIELTDGAAYPFFLLVQWHPERMEDDENPFCVNVLHEFLRCVHQYHDYRIKEMM